MLGLYGHRAHACYCLFICVMMGRHTVEGLSESELSQFTARTLIESNTGLQGRVSIDPSNPDYYVISSNGIPDHTTGVFPNPNYNPNSITAQNITYKIPKSPARAISTSCLRVGPIGIAKNGIPLFHPNNYLGENAVEGDKAERFDCCDGLPNQMGEYHYHQTPGCVYNGSNDQFIGVALDGFPIYGLKDSTGKELTSLDLDECHGYTYNGGYRYRLTRDFPYIMGCFRGTILNYIPGKVENCIRSGCTGLHHVSVIIFSVLLAVVTTL